MIIFEHLVKSLGKFLPLAFGMQAFEPIALPLAFVLSAAEFITGFALLFNLRAQFFVWIALLFMAIFTPLTFYLALENPVSDCGCFGDAWVITNWETFWKNIIINVFVILLFISRKDIKQYLSCITEWIVIGIVAIFGFGLLAYGARRMVTKNQDRLGLFFSFIGASVVLSLAATTDTEKAPYGVPAIGWLIGGLIMLGVGITIGSLSQRFPAIGIIFRGIGFIFIITGAAMMMFGVTPEYATWTLYGWAVLVLLIALWVVASYILRLR